jgi:hypothetical protein
MKKQYIAMVLAAVLLGAGLLVAAAANKPTTVLHVVTVKWKDGTTQEQIDAALQGVEKLAADYPGIRRVWLRSIKVQGTETGATHAFVMEFANERALADYANSEAQKTWYEVYLPVRDQSRTFDITN